MFNNVKAFKAVDLEIIEKFELKDLKSELLDGFNKNKQQMTLFDYNESACGLNHKFINMNAPDLFEFLLLCLTKSQDEISEVVMDEESYSVAFKFAGTHLAIDLFKGDQTTVINFRKVTGCVFKY